MYINHYFTFISVSFTFYRINKVFELNFYIKHDSLELHPYLISY